MKYKSPKSIEALAKVWVKAILSPREDDRWAALRHAKKLEAKLGKLSGERAKTRALAMILELQCDQEPMEGFEFGDN